jgi:hypothetical protein
MSLDEMNVIWEEAKKLDENLSPTPPPGGRG